MRDKFPKETNCYNEELEDVDFDIDKKFQETDTNDVNSSKKLTECPYAIQKDHKAIPDLNNPEKKNIMAFPEKKGDTDENNNIKKPSVNDALQGPDDPDNPLRGPLNLDRYLRLSTLEGGIEYAISEVEEAIIYWKDSQFGATLDGEAFDQARADQKQRISELEELRGHLSFLIKFRNHGLKDSRQNNLDKELKTKVDELIDVLMKGFAVIGTKREKSDTP